MSLREAENGSLENGQRREVADSSCCSKAEERNEKLEGEAKGLERFSEEVNENGIELVEEAGGPKNSERMSK